jgi:hypothetical protein
MLMDDNLLFTVFHPLYPLQVVWLFPDS